MRHGLGQQIVWSNLIVAIAAIVFSLFGFQFVFSGNEDRLKAFNSSSLHRIPNAASELGVHLATFPYPLDSYSFFVAPPFGVGDASHRVSRFFLSNVKPLSDKGDTIAKGFRCESEILKHLLSATNATEKRVLHLCSAAACVGPYLTQLHANTVQKNLGHSLHVSAFVYGEAVLGGAVMVDLERIGVQTARYKYVPPSFDRRLATTSKTATPTATAMPLHGVIDGGEEIAVANCSTELNTCRYDTSRNKRATMLPTVAIYPFDSVRFGSTDLESTRFDVAYIDLSAGEALAVVAYLRAVLATAQAMRPLHIFVVLHPTSLLESELKLLEALRREGGYGVFPTGGSCRYTTPTTTRNEETRDFVEVLREFLRIRGPSWLTPTNVRSFAGKPLCVLILSQTYATLPQLLQQVGSIKELDALTSFFYGEVPTAKATDTSRTTNRGEKNTTNGISIPRVPFSPSNVNYGDDKWGVMTWMIILLMPTVIAGILIYGISRSGRR